MDRRVDILCPYIQEKGSIDISGGVLTISEEVINRVNAIYRSKKIPIVASNFRFQWRLDGKDIYYDSYSEDDEDTNDAYDNVLPPPPIMLVVNNDIVDDLKNEESENMEDLGAQENSNEVGAPLKI